MPSIKIYPYQVNFTQKLLMDEYLRRKSNNSLYSLRAFARTLQLPAGRLSELVSGKRSATKAMIAKLSDRLKLKPAQIEAWLEAVELDKRERKDSGYFAIDAKEIDVLADWYHFAILALMKTSDFVSDPKWIASRLKLKLAEVNEALARLEQVGLIKVAAGEYRLLKGAVTTGHEIASMAIRHSHRQYLKQAAESLDTVPVEFRDITSICMAIDVDKIPAAKRKLEKFRREMSEFLTKGETTEVYRLNLQLFPTSFR